MDKNKFHGKTISVILISIIIVIALTGYKFLIKKDYSFIVEASCDPSTYSCFVRDCTNPDDCPPNELSEYRVFKIRASDFERCTDNSCIREIESGMIPAEEIMCGTTEEDECSE